MPASPARAWWRSSSTSRTRRLAGARPTRAPCCSVATVRSWTRCSAIAGSRRPGSQSGASRWAAGSPPTWPPTAPPYAASSSSATPCTPPATRSSFVPTTSRAWRSRCCSCRARATPSATWSCFAPCSPGCRARRSTPSRVATTPSASRAARDERTPTCGRRSSRWPRAGCGGSARSGRAAPRLPARRERGPDEAGVIRAQPGDGRRLALGHEAEDLARLEVLVEPLEHVGYRPGRGCVVGVASEEERELLLVGDLRRAEALDGGGAHGLGELRARPNAHLAQALGQKLGVGGLPLRDDAQPAAEAVEGADGDPRRQHLGRGRLGRPQVVEEADHPLALGL